MTIDKDEVLNRWAKKEAVADIARAIGLGADPGRQVLKQIMNMVAYARRQGDERATIREGGKKVEDGVRGTDRQLRALRKRRADGEQLDGWHFGVTTIDVPWLGICSNECGHVPISVSCVPRRAPVTQVILSKPRRKTDGHKTFADAFASRAAVQSPGLAGRSNRAAGSSQAQAAPKKP